MNYIVLRTSKKLLLLRHNSVFSIITVLLCENRSEKIHENKLALPFENAEMHLNYNSRRSCKKILIRAQIRK